MKPRPINLLLVLAILPGCFLAWQSGRERSRLEARYERMVRIAGDLPIEDPSMVYVRAVDTGEPLHYAWHFHLPPNYSLILRNETGGGSGGSSTSSSTGSRDFIGRVRFQPDAQGLLTVYTHFDGSSGMMGIGDLAFADLVKAHRGEIRVEQLGSTGLAVLEPGQTAVLLRLTLPDHLLGEARKSLSAQGQPSVPMLFKLELGPRPGHL